MGEFSSNIVIQFSVWLRNRLISAGLEPVLSHTEKSQIESSHKYRTKNHKT